MVADQHRDDSVERRSPKGRLFWITGVILVLSVCLGSAGGLTYFWARTTGVIQPWQKMEQPPEKVVEFVTGDINVIYVGTAAGGVYGCAHEQADEAFCWFAAQEPYKVDPETDFDSSVYQGELKPPRGAIVDELVATIWYADAAFETRYILLDDGTIWKWENDKGMFNLLICMLGPVIGLIIGITIAIVLWVGFGIQRLKRGQNQ